jgi:hypothetical protein
LIISQIGRVGWDDLAIVGIDGNDLLVRGLNASYNRQDTFRVEIPTGKPTGHPYTWPDR